MDFKTLTQKNVDHYNEHPFEHAVLTAALGMVGFAVARRIVLRLAKEDPNLRSGMYA